jgi:hypothetical protein
MEVSTMAERESAHSDGLSKFTGFFGLILFAALLSSCSSTLSGRQSPQKYNCGTVSSFGHCYSEGILGPYLTGFRTTLDVAGSFQGGNGFVNNEVWLRNNEGNEGWLEIGYDANQFERTKYFWAVLDPETGLYRSHDIGPIPQSEFGTRVVLDIHQIADSTFAMSLIGNQTVFRDTVRVNLWEASYGGTVTVGQELAGDSGAVASSAEFVETQVYDNTFRMRFASDIDHASEVVAKPPYGGWLQKPAAGNKGGVFITYCCSQ